jgi:hypothetical protein
LGAEKVNRTIFFYLMVIAAALMAACANTYVPSKTGDAKIENLPAYSNEAVVSLVNGQPEKKSVKIGAFWNIGASYAKYNAWTDIAIHHTGKALKRMGMQIALGGNKELQLRVVKAHVTDG